MPDLINRTIRISLRGDKTIVGREMGFFNFCFSLPDEVGNVCKSASGNYTLGLFNVQSDDYKTMSEAMKEQVDNLVAMNRKIEVAGVQYEIKWSLAGDMVWLHTERG